MECSSVRFQDRPIFEGLEDNQLLGLCIYCEAAGEPTEGRIAVGTVVLERVDKQVWMGKTIQQVILMPWQFSFVMPEAGEEYYNKCLAIADDFVHQLTINTALKECYAIAVGLINGTIPRDPDLHAVHCTQYLNPKTAATTQAKWLDHGMKIVKVIGKHDFFCV